VVDIILNKGNIVTIKTITLLVILSFVELVMLIVLVNFKGLTAVVLL